MDTQSSWAAKYMKTHGWNEGEGIGKTLQGRTDPIKDRIKITRLFVYLYTCIYML